LKKENPHVHEHFQRFSEEIQEDEEFLQELALQKMRTVCKEKREGCLTVDIDALQSIAIPLQRRVVQLILNYLYKKRPESLSAIHIEHFFSLIEGERPSGSLDFPEGLKIIRSYRLCHFRFDFDPIEEAPFYFELNEPGVCCLPNGDCITLVEADEIPEDAGSDLFKINREDLNFPIIIRTREPGDRMSIKGMKGTKKIKSLFIDGKVPREQRKSWPIVTDGNKEILWLPGLKRSSMEMDNEKGKTVFIFIYKKTR
jgi:tRNA(Ile)-lysidine synthase